MYSSPNQTAPGDIFFRAKKSKFRQQKSKSSQNSSNPPETKPPRAIFADFYPSGPSNFEKHTVLALHSGRPKPSRLGRFFSKIFEFLLPIGPRVRWRKTLTPSSLAQPTTHSLSLSFTSHPLYFFTLTSSPLHLFFTSSFFFIHPCGDQQQTII